MDGLLAVSQRGAWTEWIAFFLDGIIEQAYSGTRQGRNILALRETYRKRYQAARSIRVLPLIDELFMRPVFTAPQMSDSLGWARYSVQRLLDSLIADGVLEETTGRQRNRIFLAPEIMELLEA